MDRFSKAREGRWAAVAACAVEISLLGGCSAAPENRDGGTADAGGSDVAPTRDSGVDGRVKGDAAAGDGHADVSNRARPDGSEDAGMDGSATDSATDAATDASCPAGSPSSDWDESPIPNSSVDVTAGAPNPESYTDNGDGTVTDDVTGLLWQQVVPTTLYSAANAAIYCGGLALASCAWRLPTEEELFSIVDLAASSLSIDTTVFPSTPAGIFWSSTVFAGAPSLTWYVDFGKGQASVNDGYPPSYVRCVH